VEIDKDMKVLDISDRNMEGRLAFTGIHIIDPVILSHIPAGTFSSIITCYREIIRSGGRIGAYVAKGHWWRDIGTVDSYREANRETLKPSPILVDSGGVIDPSARLEDWVVVGRNAHIERGAELRRSILWEDVFVKEGVRVIDSIVKASRSVDRDLVQEIY
jgi:NDP-sugar pyrophosphorylase family protein